VNWERGESVSLPSQAFYISSSTRGMDTRIRYMGAIAGMGKRERGNARFPRLPPRLRHLSCCCSG
jgi:hypothetical protein